jgi:hypothetical protein
MAVARLWRFCLAAALLVAMQSSLLHPFEHFQKALGARAAAGGAPTVKAIDDRHPLETLQAQLCEICVAGAALAAAASASSAPQPVFFSGGFAASRQESLFLAAFTPLFRSQAPPALL